jgi:hypothetical protein
MIEFVKRIVLAGISYLILLSVLNAQYVPGEVYYGRKRYIEYWCGNYPLIISAPHAGILSPSEIPDRSWGLKDNDEYTYEIVKYVRDSVFARTGKYPHVIINRLKRRKIDPNREILEATDSDPFSTISYNEYHAFIDSAKSQVIKGYGKGLYNDFHGHNHPIKRIEIGYLLRNDDLTQPDSVLENIEYMNRSSIKNLAKASSLTFSQLVRGSKSLGKYFEDHGYQAVPSLLHPDASLDPYFSGGYSILEHGSIDSGSIDGVQIEVSFSGVRDNDANRMAFAGAYAAVLERYLSEHYLDISGNKDEVGDFLKRKQGVSK